MAIFGSKLIVALGAFGGVARAQFPPTPTGVTVLESKLSEGVKISYKEVGPLFQLKDESLMRI